MDHLSWDDVWAYLDGERTATESTLEHIRHCGECSEKWNAATRMHESLVVAFTESVPKPSEEAVNRLLTTLRSMHTPPARHSSHRRLQRWMILSSGATAAAAVAIVALVGLHGTSHTERGNSASSTSSTVAMGVPSGPVANSTQSTTPPASSPTKSAQSAAQAPPMSAGGNSTPTSAVSADSSVSSTTPSTASTDDANQSVANTAVPQTEGQASLQGQDAKNAIQAPNGPASSSMSPAAVLAPATVAGTVQVSAVDTAGKPLSDVHVALVTNGQVQTSAVTDDDGKTPSVNVQVPQDPLLQGTFAAPGWPPQGVLTVVAWKDGYQPQVYYGVGVFAFGSTTYNVQLTMAPATTDRVRVSGDGAQGDYHLLMWHEFAYGAERMVQSAVSSGQVNGLSAGDAQLRFTVKNQDGKPVAGAEVAIIAGGRITGYGTTSGSGQVLIDASGVPDWRTVDGTPVAGIVVLKDGYVPAAGLMQPVPPGAQRDISVRLESIAWRTARHYNNLDAPTAVAGMRVPSQAEAEQVFNLAVSAVENQ